MDCASPPGFTTRYGYDDAHRLTTVTDPQGREEQFRYDLNGNLTGDGTTTYTWNARDQLTGLSGAATASFQYDGIGRRRARTLSGTTTNFLYDGLNLAQELSSSGTPTANLLTSLGIDEIFVRTDGIGRPVGPA